jgi:hypothetical protein
MLVSTILAFCLLSGIGFSADYDLIYNNENITIDRTNVTPLIYGFGNNISHFFVLSYRSGPPSVNSFNLIFNLQGAYTGQNMSLGNGSNNEQPVGFAQNSTHYGILFSGNYTEVQIYDKNFNSVQNFSVGSEETSPQGLEWYNGFWYMTGFTTDRVYQYDKAGTYTNLNFSVGTECKVPIAINNYGEKFYIYCDGSGALDDFNVTILRYSTSGVYDNYFYNMSANEGCPNVSAGGGMALRYNVLYPICAIAIPLPNLNAYGYEIESEISTPGNITRDVIEIQRQLLGIRNQGDALMLYSIGIASFFGLLAVIMVRKQPIILFTITFILGLITFSYIGWLPTTFLFIMIIISGIILAWKMTSVFIGDT